MLNHHIRFYHYFPFLKKQLNELFLAHAIDSFVNSLFGIFIPIYLLTLGYSVPQILMYFIIVYLASALFFFFAGYLSTHLGLKHTMFIRLPFFLFFLILLYFLGSITIPLVLIGVLHGFCTALYWMPLHSLFARSASKDHLGKEVGELHSFPRLASVVAPLLGGLITMFFGFGTLFIISMILLLFSLIPLFYTPEIKPHVDFNIKEIKNIVKGKSKYFFGLGVQYMGDAVEVVIWPIFVFLILENILSIGLIGTFLFGGGVLFSLLVGKLSDRYNRRTFIRIGAILMILIYFFKFFAGSAVIIYLLTILSGFFIVLLSVPFDSIIYGLAKRSNADEFIIVKEIFVSSGRVFLLLMGLILVKKLGLTFLIASLSHIFFLFF